MGYKASKDDLRVREGSDLDPGSVVRESEVATSNLQPGDRGSEVEQLQDFLISQGYLTQERKDTGPGIYGPRTTEAVRQLQEALGVDNTSGPGYFGPRTMQALSREEDEDEIERLGEGGIVDRDGRRFRINPAGELIPLDTTPDVPDVEDVQPSIDDINAQIDKMVQDAVDLIIASGKTVNPNLTDKDLAELDPAVFITQAEASVADEYKQKFANVKSDLVRGFQNIGVDLGIQLAGIERETEQARLTGREELAGRGLTFSGRREKFETDVTEASQRAEDASRLISGREAIRIGNIGERSVGTERLRGLDFGVGGQTPFALSQEPQIGSLERERQFTIESLAKEEEKQERERRAFTTRNLSFA